LTTLGQIAIGDLFSGYCEQIERLIGEANYRDAFANLQDFIRDFSPAKKRNVLALCSRYHRWREAQSLGLRARQHQCHCHPVCQSGGRW
jgi:hypothetical protein